MKIEKIISKKGINEVINKQNLKKLYKKYVEKNR